LLFNSAEFLLGFLPVVLIVYYLLPHRGQNAFLVLASCFFYASWDWRFLAPLLFTTSLDYWIARRMEAEVEAGRPLSSRRKYLVVSVIANLGLLAFFKYFNFFAQSAVQLAQSLGMDIGLRTFEIVLPLAISFYTFQALSYTIDVYRGELHATKSFWDFFLAVLYFPHLIAGPIQRAATLLPQVVNPRRIHREQVLEGLHLIAWGFFKKVFIADNLAPIVDAAFANPTPSGGVTVLAVYAFTFQIYCDFSGYTDIARGLAKLMGFEFVLNFKLPYFATNPSDFWRRWHISLSTWLRDYLYKPLGGNRDGSLLTNRNLLLTMVLGGLWHGAAWNFVLWGLYHGVLLVGHRLLEPALARVGRLLGSAPQLWWLIRVASMFLLTCYGWLLFRATSLDQVLAMTASLAHPLQGIDWDAMARVTLIILPLLLVQVIQARSGELFFMKLPSIPVAVRVIAYAVMLYLTLFLGGQPQSFVYFQF
jgi:alginate O-acetyltransferase complex protein AlgI